MVLVMETGNEEYALSDWVKIKRNEPVEAEKKITEEGNGVGIMDPHNDSKRTSRTLEENCRKHQKKSKQKPKKR